jgi:hypothetical protein
MRIARWLWTIALVLVNGIALYAADEDPADEKNWLNEKIWPAFVAAHRMEITEKDDALTRLVKERHNSAQQELRSRYVYWLQGAESLPQVYEAAGRAMEGRSDVGGKRGEKTIVLKEKVAFAKVVEQQAQGLLKKFNRSSQVSDVDCAKYFRATAELELLRAEKQVSSSGVRPGTGSTPNTESRVR